MSSASENTKEVTSISNQNELLSEQNSAELCERPFMKRKFLSMGRTGTLDQFKANKKSL